MKCLFSILIAVACGAVAMPTAGLAQERWRMDQERYSCFTSDMTLQELASGGVTVISHTPATKQYCEEARKWGIKACPYVSLYKVIDSSKDRPFDGNDCGGHLAGVPLLTSPFWKELDASKHPEWLLRREDGEIRRPFNEADYLPQYHQSCCNHRDLMTAYERGVRNVMELGAGGVFVDNVHPYPECFGAKLGLHTHDWPDKNNVECYKMALKRVHDAVKSYGDDCPVLLNGYAQDAQYISFGDCLMWESFAWRSPIKGDQPPMVTSRRCGNWEEFVKLYSERLPQGRDAVTITALTYLPAPATEPENAFFAYAQARLVGFSQWTATCVKRRDILRRLYRVKTGEPISEIVNRDGAAYRQFENALIVCNLSKWVIEARVPVPEALGANLIELYGMNAIAAADGHVALALPAESGRVIVSRSDGLDNLLREIEGQSLAARLHIEEAGGDRGSTDLVETLKKVETGATALRATVHEARFPTDVQFRTLGDILREARAIQTPDTSDGFLVERLDNLRNHAAQMSHLVSEAEPGISNINFHEEP